MQLAAPEPMAGQLLHASTELEFPRATFAPAVHYIKSEYLHRLYVEPFVLEPAVRIIFVPEVLLLHL